MVQELVDKIFKAASEFERTGDKGEIDEDLVKLRTLLKSKYNNNVDLDYKMAEAESARDTLFSCSIDYRATMAARLRNCVHVIPSMIEDRFGPRE